MKRTSVLRDRVQRPPERAEAPPVHGVAVGGGDDVRAGVVDGAVDHEGGGVEQPAVAAVDDLALVVDADQVRGVDERERDAERVHPERVRLDRVAQRDVASDAFVEAVLRVEKRGQRSRSRCGPSMTE